MRVSSKYHFKSTSLYAFFMWLILRLKYIPESKECHFFSYQAEMAKYHVGSSNNKDSIKALIERNPYFEDLIDLKQNAETVVNYTWDKENNITLTPHGMMTFKRGLHCNGAVFVDDALADPAEKLDPTKVHRINDIFFKQIMDIPDEGVPMHVVGTAQTQEDFYFDERVKEEFAVKVMPAFKNAKINDVGEIIDGEPLWPEWLNKKQLLSRQKLRGVKTFSQEYMCNPVYDSSSFFKREQIEPLVKHQSVSKFEPSDSDVIAGYDLGKHSHPSHFAVHRIKDGKRKQLVSKWFDRMDYIDQIDIIEGYIERLGIYKVYFDNSRGELETLEEQGKLPSEFEGINFTRKNKNAMATEFEIAVNSKRIEFVEDKRQLNQILVVDNDLKARETTQGHGDSFWSNALTFADALESKVEMYIPTT